MSAVLLASVDRELIRFVRAALRDSGVRVTGEYGTVKDLAEAYKDLSDKLVVIDTFLPNSSGLEVLTTLKRMNEHGIFLLLSRMRTRTVLEKAFRMGAQDVLLYPVEAEILRDTILRRLVNQPQKDAEDPAKASTPAKPPRG